VGTRFQRVFGGSGAFERAARLGLEDRALGDRSRRMGRWVVKCPVDGAGRTREQCEGAAGRDCRSVKGVGHRANRVQEQRKCVAGQDRRGVKRPGYGAAPDESGLGARI